MPDIIKQLPDSVANQIAAGEVIQRPASLVKELMENAIDAGAKNIRVIVKDAGRTLVHVVDDGCGMSPADARAAFERHSTSKIRQASDLFSIRTMGFRGEALASIAAVAEVSLKTRRHEDDLGTKINIHGSKFKDQEPVSCPAGSNFMVKNLFFNVPARRKFLKTNTTEFRHIVNEFYRVALSQHELKFSLAHNQKEIYNLSAGPPKQRIISLFGKNMNQILIPLNSETSIIRIHGFVGKPESARKPGGEQFFFINRRFMRHPYLHKAIMSAYENVLAPDVQPAYFLFLEASSDLIDVNIHPSKTEIKFEDERSIFQIIQASVREVLGKHNLVPSLDFDREDAIDIPHLKKDRDFKMPLEDVDPDYNPFEPKKISTSKGSAASYRNRGWEDFYRDLTRAENYLSAGIQKKFESQPEHAKTGLMQFKNRYILLAVKSGLMIVDQKRAHERILYERFLGTLQHRTPAAQHELYPVTVDLNAADHSALIEIIDDICSLGFVIGDLGKSGIEIKAMPAEMKSLDPKEWLESFLKDYMEEEADIKAEASARLAASMARTCAVKYGRSLQPEEMRDLLDRLFACKEPGISASGKAVFRILPTEDLEKLFN